jgi:hypothetical protein
VIVALGPNLPLARVEAVRLNIPIAAILFDWQKHASRVGTADGGAL